jgi:hypothetical protein
MDQVMRLFVAPEAQRSVLMMCQDSPQHSIQNGMDQEQCGSFSADDSLEQMLPVTHFLAFTKKAQPLAIVNWQLAGLQNRGGFES